MFGAANQPNITPEQRIQIAQGFLLAAIADALERILDQIGLDLPMHPEPDPEPEPEPLEERIETFVRRKKPFYVKRNVPNDPIPQWTLDKSEP